MQIKNATILNELVGGGVRARLDGPATSITVDLEPAADPFVRVFARKEAGEIEGYTLGAIVKDTLVLAIDRDAVCDSEGEPIPSKGWWNPATGRSACYMGKLEGWNLGE